MAVLSQLRYPTSRLAKVFSAILALIVFLVVSLSTISGFLLYQIVHPARNPAVFDLSVMMGHPAAVSFTLPDGGSREGWFYPGLRGAPTVIVCHGYQEQRADVLTLVTALQDHQFNVYLFDFLGHGAVKGPTTLGYKETDELRAAIKMLAGRDDVDPQHFGLWGVDMGGYAALEVASTDPRIAALAVDDAYDDPRHMVQIEVKKSGLTALPYVLRLADFGFRMMNYQHRNAPPISARLGGTRLTAKLFILSDDRPALAQETARIFSLAPDLKQMVRETASYRDMPDDDRKAYESQIVNFFLQYMPPIPR